MSTCSAALLVAEVPAALQCILPRYEAHCWKACFPLQLLCRVGTRPVLTNRGAECAAAWHACRAAGAASWGEAARQLPAPAGATRAADHCGVRPDGHSAPALHSRPRPGWHIPLHCENSMCSRTCLSAEVTGIWRPCSGRCNVLSISGDTSKGPKRRSVHYRACACLACSSGCPESR